MTDDLDLGDGYRLRFVSWSPDRDLNPQYADLPDVDRWGAILVCPHREGAITFDGEVQAKLAPDAPRWTVVSWDPLTLEPSIQTRNPDCCHGYIREGKWVPA